MSVFYHCKNDAERETLKEYCKNCEFPEGTHGEYFRTEPGYVYSVSEKPMRIRPIEMEVFERILHAEKGQLFILTDGLPYTCYSVSPEQGHCMLARRCGGTLKLTAFSAYRIRAVYSVSENGRGKLLYLNAKNTKISPESFNKLNSSRNELCKHCIKREDCANCDITKIVNIAFSSEKE